MIGVLRQFSSAQFALAALGLAALTIAGAWAFEIVGGYQPCALCLTQRNPYYIGIPFLAVAAVIAGRGSHRSVLRLLLGLAAVVFLVGAGYGVYHSGVEWGWWPGPAACGAGSDTAESVGDLLTQLETVQVIRCDEVQWRAFGLTFANYNVLISLAIAALALAAAGRTYGSSSVSQ